MVSNPTAFWDTSALVPLCVRQPTTIQANLYMRKFSPVVWWASKVELHSAIKRLHRIGELKDKEVKVASTRIALLMRVWKEILPTDASRDLAIRLLDSYDLRAADSLQLAAALMWCQQRPARKTFICADQRLSSAATACGFSVLELSPP